MIYTHERISDVALSLELNLSDVMSSEALLQLLSDSSIAEQLLPHLPESQRNPEELANLVRFIFTTTTTTSHTITHTQHIPLTSAGKIKIK